MSELQCQCLVEPLPGVSYLLPDNVHFQHTAQFIRALTEADVDFRIQVSLDLGDLQTLKNSKNPKNELHLTPPTHPSIQTSFFGNPKLTWIEHSNHND